MAEVAKSAAPDPRPAPAQGALTIDSHRRLLGRRKAIVDRLTSEPVLGKLLFANAALAFKEAGVTLSPAIANHVLHTVKQSQAAITRREQLGARLREALGVVPHPSDPKWLAQTLFTKLELTALDTRGHQPAYRPAVPADAEARMRARLVPASRPRLPARTGTAPPPRPVPFRLDLDAEVPELPAATERPSAVPLPDLWFYLGAHELVRPLLELGILEVSVMPTLTRNRYEAVRNGARTGGFLDWIDSVTFRAESPPVRTTAAKKTAAKKTAAKKTAAKKTAAKKTGAKKVAAKKVANTASGVDTRKGRRRSP